MQDPAFAAPDYLDEMPDRVRETMAQLQRIIQPLHPPALRGNTLTDASGQLCRNFAKEDALYE